MSFTWFCPDCDTSYAKRVRSCKSCKGRCHYRCVPSQQSGRYEHFWRHCTTCEFCAALGEEGKKLAQKRKQTEELFQHEYGTRHVSDYFSLRKAKDPTL